MGRRRRAGERVTPDPWCPSTTRHGTVQAYNSDRCRCTAARLDAARYGREWYHRNRQQPLKVPSCGTRRRLEALAAAGWPAEHIASLIGVCPEALRSLRIRASILRSSADRVAAVYEQLAAQPGPSTRCAKRARARGCLPPSRWTADTIDDPDASPLSPWQQYLAARPTPLLFDRDVLDDQADRELDAVLDAIEAEDEAWFAARRAAA